MSRTAEYSQWTVLQTYLVSSVSPDAIPHGALFPIDRMAQFLPHGGLLVELGSGRGECALDLIEAGFSWMGLEINKEAVETAEQSGFVSLWGDARNFWKSSINLAAIAMIENSSAVLLQGLLANIIENRDIRNVIRTADIFLRPGGYLFMAEPIRFQNITWFDQSISYGGYTISEWEDRWKLRYQLNEKAGLPRGAFVVAKPGPEKDKLDWAEDLKYVRALINSDQKERFARHINPDAIVAYAKRQYFSLLDRQNVLMLSRNGKPLPGVHMVFQKDYGLNTKRHERLYRYSPWYKGMTLDERHDNQDFRRWQAHADPRGYHSDYWTNMCRNFPQSMQPPKEYMI